MAVPKNTNKYGNYLKRKKLSDASRIKCNKQFPDCPAEPNKKNCIGCPFYKK